MVGAVADPAREGDARLGREAERRRRDVGDAVALDAAVTGSQERHRRQCGRHGVDGEGVARAGRAGVAGGVGGGCDDGLARPLAERREIGVGQAVGPLAVGVGRDAVAAAGHRDGDAAARAGIGAAGDADTSGALGGIDDAVAGHLVHHRCARGDGVDGHRACARGAGVAGGVGGHGRQRHRALAQRTDVSSLEGVTPRAVGTGGDGLDIGRLPDRAQGQRHPGTGLGRAGEGHALLQHVDDVVAGHGVDDGRGRGIGVDGERDRSAARALGAGVALDHGAETVRARGQAGGRVGPGVTGDIGGAQPGGTVVDDDHVALRQRADDGARHGRRGVVGHRALQRGGVGLAHEEAGHGRAGGRGRDVDGDAESGAGRAFVAGRIDHANRQAVRGVGEVGGGEGPSAVLDRRIAQPGGAVEDDDPVALGGTAGGTAERQGLVVGGGVGRQHTGVGATADVVDDLRDDGRRRRRLGVDGDRARDGIADVGRGILRDDRQRLAALTHRQEFGLGERVRPDASGVGLDRTCTQLRPGTVAQHDGGVSPGLPADGDTGTSLGGIDDVVTSHHADGPGRRSRGVERVGAGARSGVAGAVGGTKRDGVSLVADQRRVERDKALDRIDAARRIREVDAVGHGRCDHVPVHQHLQRHSLLGDRLERGGRILGPAITLGATVTGGVQSERAEHRRHRVNRQADRLRRPGVAGRVGRPHLDFAPDALAQGHIVGIGQRVGPGTVLGRRDAVGAATDGHRHRRAGLDAAGIAGHGLGLASLGQVDDVVIRDREHGRLSRRLSVDDDFTCRGRDAGVPCGVGRAGQDSPLPLAHGGQIRCDQGVGPGTVGTCLHRARLRPQREGDSGPRLGGARDRSRLLGRVQHVVAGNGRDRRRCRCHGVHRQVHRGAARALVATRGLNHRAEGMRAVAQPRGVESPGVAAADDRDAQAHRAVEHDDRLARLQRLAEGAADPRCGIVGERALQGRVVGRAVLETGDRRKRCRHGGVNRDREGRAGAAAVAGRILDAGRQAVGRIGEVRGEEGPGPGLGIDRGLAEAGCAVVHDDAVALGERAHRARQRQRLVVGGRTRQQGAGLRRDVVRDSRQHGYRRRRHGVHCERPAHSGAGIARHIRDDGRDCDGPLAQRRDVRRLQGVGPQARGISRHATGHAAQRQGHGGQRLGRAAEDAALFGRIQHIIARHGSQTGHCRRASVDRDLQNGRQGRVAGLARLVDDARDEGVLARLQTGHLNVHIATRDVLRHQHARRTGHRPALQHEDLVARHGGHAAIRDRVEGHAHRDVRAVGQVVSIRRSGVGRRQQVQPQRLLRRHGVKELALRLGDVAQVLRLGDGLGSVGDLALHLERGVGALEHRAQGGRIVQRDGGAVLDGRLHLRGQVVQHRAAGPRARAFGQREHGGDLGRGLLRARVGGRSGHRVEPGQVGTGAGDAQRRGHRLRGRLHRVSRLVGGVGANVRLEHRLHQGGQRVHHGRARRGLQRHVVGHARVDVDTVHGNDGAARRVRRQEEVAFGVGFAGVVVRVKAPYRGGVGRAVAVGVDVDLGTTDVAVGNLDEGARGCLVAGQILDAQAVTGLVGVDHRHGGV